MRRKLTILLAYIMLFIALFTQGISSYVQNSLPNSTGNYIVFDIENEQVLYRNNSEIVTNSSLLNRMMTCLITLENESVTSYIVPKEDSISANERFKLSTKNQYTIDSLIKATLLGNGENTAKTMARHISETEQDFVKKMNDKAVLLNMRNTFFANVDGSYNELQHTTLMDMAIFIKDSMKNTQFKNIFCSQMALIWGNFLIPNDNKLVTEDETYPYVIGGTLGYFNNFPVSQCTSIFYTETDKTDSVGNMKLLIIMDDVSGDSYKELTEELLRTVKTNYKRDLLVPAGEVIYTMNVDGRTLNLISPNNVYCIVAVDFGNIVQSKSHSFSEGYSPEIIKPPIEAGTIIGNAHYLLKNGSTIRFPIVAENNITVRKTTVKSMIDILKEQKGLYYLIISLIILEGILLLFKAVKLFRYMVTKRNN